MLEFHVVGLTRICGIALVSNPLFGSGVPNVLSAHLLVDGGCEIAATLDAEPKSAPVQPARRHPSTAYAAASFSLSATSAFASRNAVTAALRNSMPRRW